MPETPLSRSTVIAPARAGEAAALSAVARAAKKHWGYPDAWLQQWDPLLTITEESLHAGTTLVARAQGRTVGFVALRPDEGGAVIEHLWVIPDAMGQGIGRALFTAAEAEARALGVPDLEVEADPHAEGFYHRMGMVTTGYRPADMEGQSRRLPLLRKSLSPLA